MKAEALCEPDLVEEMIGKGLGRTLDPGTPKI